LSPLGGRSVRQGAAAVRARCRADGGQERGQAAQPCAGAVQRRRCISRCTDRSAGGCAAWRTFSTTRARAWGGRDAAEASSRRCASWRSRGRRWRGPSARATDRPCRAASAPCRLVRSLRRGQVSLGNRSCASHCATALRQQPTAPARAATCHCLGRPGPSRRRELCTQAGENRSEWWGKWCCQQGLSTLPAEGAGGGPAR